MQVCYLEKGKRIAEIDFESRLQNGYSILDRKMQNIYAYYVFSANKLNEMIFTLNCLLLFFETPGLKMKLTSCQSEATRPFIL